MLLKSLELVKCDKCMVWKYFVREADVCEDIWEVVCLSFWSGWLGLEGRFREVWKKFCWCGYCKWQSKWLPWLVCWLIKIRGRIEKLTPACFFPNCTRNLTITPIETEATMPNKVLTWHFTFGRFLFLQCIRYQYIKYKTYALTDCVSFAGDSSKMPSGKSVLVRLRGGGVDWKK